MKRKLHVRSFVRSDIVVNIQRTAHGSTGRWGTVRVQAQITDIISDKRTKVEKICNI
jgi:hypothetical protein